MVATVPIDFSKGSLAKVVKNALHEDPFTGTVFVFRAKKTVSGVLRPWALRAAKHRLQSGCPVTWQIDLNSGHGEACR
jgi:transposase